MSYYITTAIDYVNGKPHLGHAYEKVAADALARYHRLKGEPTRFLTGVDEHSQNVERAARREGLEPLPYTDRMAERFQAAWAALDISHDDFIRTTEKRHSLGVETLFDTIQSKGDIYAGLYEGWYCVGCEGFKQEKDLAEGLCPVHHTKPDWIREDNYFFRLSRYQQPLLDHYASHPDFLVPEERKNEILNVIRGGLDDISVTRTGTTWGITLPSDPRHVVYVWFDALINYISGVGYGDDSPTGRALWQTWWPADLHVIGKDITRFHCIIWPAMLLSGGVPLPKQILAHGWVLQKGEKMSKSLGNIVDPMELVDRVGPDALRYYLLKEVPLHRDGDFTWDLFIERYNSDLANDLGNLVSRTVAMADKYFAGRLPTGNQIDRDGVDGELRAVVDAALPAYVEAFERLAVDEAIAAARGIIRRANQYIEETAPWTLAKDLSLKGRLGAVLNALVESVRIVAILLSPVVPRKCSEILTVLNVSPETRALTLADLRWEPEARRPTAPLGRITALFPRIDREGA